MREIYLDNCATTATDPDIAAIALDLMTTSYGNPSSLHKKGLEAQLLLEQARGRLATAIGCQPEEVYFTSGGTEANNLALIGAFSAGKRRASRVVGGKAEHSSVLGALEWIREQGGETALVDPRPDGGADPEQISAALNQNTLLLSCGLVNGETGAISQVGEIAGAAKLKCEKILIHCDGVQALGKLPISVKKLGVDLLSLSGHKLHAPKGIGALYIRKGVRIHPLLRGGGQERTLRPGTESVPLACAFGASVEKMTSKINQNFVHYQSIREHFLKRAQKVSGLCINSPPDGAPYICNVSLPGYRSETMLHFLAERGIYVSGGSACSKGKVSHILTAAKLPRKRIESALRVSFCKDTTTGEIDAFFDALALGLDQITRSK